MTRSDYLIRKIINILKFKKNTIDEENITIEELTNYQ